MTIFNSYVSLQEATVSERKHTDLVTILGLVRWSRPITISTLRKWPPGWRVFQQVNQHKKMADFMGIPGLVNIQKAIEHGH